MAAARKEILPDEELLFSYQRVLFQAFGRVQYGCCENLTTKIETVKGDPNCLRDWAHVSIEIAEKYA